MSGSVGDGAVRTLSRRHSVVAELASARRQVGMTPVRTVANLNQSSILLANMATSVKIDDETKSRLERLQTEIRLKTGKRVTQQEILARLVENAVESKADLIDDVLYG
ncbi:hypothetical protein GCM10007209_31600 [Haloferax sulfurifontis]|uniref:Uncharacterized protein n=2 Tax=Haloferax sulfurifontis TaxID=255616 RepID=A0A830E123_9EURY|nr:hypothetical protein GCM10007209_31600 [Haloferax sulfurifontis]